MVSCIGEIIEEKTMASIEFNLILLSFFCLAFNVDAVVVDFFLCEDTPGRCFELLLNDMIINA